MKILALIFPRVEGARLDVVLGETGAPFIEGFTPCSLCLGQQGSQEVGDSE